jgi:hypothetical protein
MKEPDLKLPGRKHTLSDILEYLQGMSETLVQLCANHNLTLLAHIYGQAAFEAKLELDAIAQSRNTPPAT